MNYCSNPTDLKITDMRFVDVDGKHAGHDMGLALKKRMNMGFYVP